MIRFLATTLGLWAWRFLSMIGQVLWALVRPSLRFISAAALVAAVIALTADVTRWQTGAGGPTFLSLDQQIRAAAPATLDAIGQTLSRGVHPMAWDPVLTTLLALPTWLTFFALSLLLGYCARERRQVDIFIN
jgi:hypothetical protein